MTKINTLAEARKVARLALTPGTIPETQSLVQAFNLLNEAESSADVALAERLDREFPDFFENYDSRGNWVGAVAYENGWTP